MGLHQGASCTTACTSRQPDMWQRVAGQQSVFQKYHHQPPVTEQTGSPRTTRNGTAKLDGCGDNTSCCSDKAIVLAKGVGGTCPAYWHTFSECRYQGYYTLVMVMACGLDSEALRCCPRVDGKDRNTNSRRSVPFQYSRPIDEKLPKSVTWWVCTHTHGRYRQSMMEDAVRL